MATSVSCGYPLYLDGATYPMVTYRQLDVGVAVLDAGTTSALTPAAGVFPEGTGIGGALKVTAGTALTVAVNAGYASVPSSVAQNGAYLFGLAQSGTLTVASNNTGSTRTDLVVAQVFDVGGTASTSNVNIITGPAVVPSNAIPLAQVSVAGSASSLTSGNITDQRTYVVAPGGILPIANAGNAPAAPASQFMWDIATSSLVQGTGTAGVVAQYGQQAPSTVYFTRVTSPSSWTLSEFNGTVQLASLKVTGDGVTNYEIYYSVPHMLYDDYFFGAKITLTIDGHQADAMYAGAGGFADIPLPAAAATYYTSSAAGTTMSKGTHTVAVSLVGDFYNQSFIAYAPITLRAAPVVI